MELFDLLNPINHSRTHIEYSRYKVEPYVMAADVYSVPPHTGREDGPGIQARRMDLSCWF